MWKFLLLFFVVNGHTYGFEESLKHIKPKTLADAQANATLGLIKRLIPDRFDEFLVEVNPQFGSGKDTFKIEKIDDKIKITGTTGVTAASGFNHYLKYFCNSHISWEVTRIDLPKELPEVNLQITLNDRFRYYQNVCTSGYSFVWWSWEQWQKHIDWMALNSFNLVLAFNGQEAIWDRVYQKFNLSRTDIDEHFSGPAFLPWLRMGNLRGFGGPLSSAWHERSLVLQKLIVNRLRSFGIITVLPAFAGHLPRAFKQLYPDVNMAKMQVWNGFNDTYCCPYFLEPTEELFNEIGIAFMREQIAEFGTDHVYNCDSFNEVDPVSTNLTYLSNVGKSIYKALTDVDDEAIWVMQGWLFVHSFYYWNKSRAKALLTSVPKGKMLILDLQSEQFPQYDRLEQYFGQPYIWCMLHNFGGTLGMFGSTDIVNEEPIRARKGENSTMVGVGLTMEGINQNYAIYEFMMENAWRSDVRNKTQWFEDYAMRRYGLIDDNIRKFWRIIQDSVYNYEEKQKIRGHYAITIHPKFNIEVWSWYKSTELFEAWDSFVASADLLKDSPGYLHDLVDVTRQVLQVTGDIYYNKLKDYFTAKDKEGFELASSLFLDVFTDLERILGSNEAFLLGRWIRDAKACANNTDDEKLFEYNARNQITLWGPNGQILDYANKQWAGVVSDYFGKRWKMFIDYTLDNFTSFDNDYIKKKVFSEVEEAFTFATDEFPSEPQGNTVEIAKEIHNRWWKIIRNEEIYGRNLMEILRKAPLSKFRENMDLDGPDIILVR